MKDCQRRTSVSKVKVEERGRKAIFDNPSRDQYVITLFDGCVVRHDTAADFIVSPQGLDIITELKGRDIEKAEFQIAATYKYLVDNAFAAPIVSALIVSSRVPLGSTQSRRIIEHLRRLGLRRVKIATGRWEGDADGFM